MVKLGTVALGLGIGAWATMILNAVVPGIGCIFGPIGPLLAIAAIVCGVIAMGSDSRSHGIIGLVLGAAYIAITIIIAVVGLVVGGIILCFYLGFLATLFGGMGLCGNLIAAAVPLTLLAGLGAVRIVASRP